MATCMHKIKPRRGSDQSDRSYLQNPSGPSAHCGEDGTMTYLRSAWKLLSRVTRLCQVWWWLTGFDVFWHVGAHHVAPLSAVRANVWRDTKGQRVCFFSGAGTRCRLAILFLSVTFLGWLEQSVCLSVSLSLSLSLLIQQFLSLLIHQIQQLIQQRQLFSSSLDTFLSQSIE